MTRVPLPAEVTQFAPGYEWRVDLDIAFAGERPDDWPDWTVRMHVWVGDVAFTLDAEDGVTIEPVEGLPGTEGPVDIPVIRMSAARTETLRGRSSANYVIEITAPDDEPEDLLAGVLVEIVSPPPELLA